MQQFDDNSSHSVLLMDNYSIHHVQPVRDVSSAAGILCIYLSSCSPDLNPVEELFSYDKYYLKQHDNLLKIITDTKPVIKAAFESALA